MKASYHTVNLTWPFAYQYLDLQDMTFLYAQIMKANEAAFPHRLNLNCIAAYFDMERNKNKHDALEDARLTAGCFAELMKRAANLKINC